VEQLKKAPLTSRFLALSTNMRLGWKGLPGPNTLAYYENPYITDVKSFITLDPGVIVIKLFLPELKNVHNKLERLFLASLPV
jgi:hypothetical protein